MGLNLTTADKALKEFYLPALRNQLNNSTPILSLIEPRKQELEGRRAVLALIVGNNEGTGARADGGTLPTAGNVQTAEERVLMRYLYQRIEVTGPAIAHMKSDKGSFVRALDLEMKGATEAIKRDTCRQMWGTSDGVIAACGVTSNDTTIVLAAATTARQMRYIRPGMLIDIGTVAEAAAGTGGPAYGVAVLTVNPTAKTFTVAAAITTDANDRVFRAGNGGATTSQKELTGLQSIVAASGSLFNVDPATYPVWVSTVLANGGTPRAISESLMRQTVDDVFINSGEYPKVGVANFGTHRAYGALLLATKRVVNTTDMKGGYKGLAFETGGPTINIVADQDCPEGEVDFLNTDHLWLGKGEDWSWMDEDGSSLSRVQNKDAYEGTLRMYGEQFTDKRNAHGKLDDITEA